MAAYAALVSLMNNIEQIMSHPRLSSSFDSTHIQPLVEKADFLLDFIEGNSYGGCSREAQHLERQIASAAHAAEDVIEAHVVDQIHSGTNEATLGCSLNLQQITRYMNAILKKANEFKEKWGLKEEQRPTHSRSPLMESGETTSTAMVGLDAELYQLLHELTGHQSSRHTISIVGMGGTGKTTLAKNVYKNQLIKEHFPFRAWATISQHHDAHEILLQLVSCLGGFTNGDVEGLGLELHKTLSGRRYLIIFDDIWSVAAWDEVRRFFPDNNNRSRIIVTTRLSNVANDCGSSCLNMNLLDEDNSWKLFCEKTFQHENCPPQLEEVGKEIVEICKGLALSIVVIGGLLQKSPRTVEYWRGIAKDMKLVPTCLKEKEESLDVLSLSYTHLPPHLKPCFLYMGVFREDSQIRVSKIIKLWVAEGFVKPHGGRVSEEIAEDYLNDLIQRNLILKGSHRRGNGKIRSCGIHDLVRDLCLKVGKQEEFFHVMDDGTGIRGTERRLVFPELSPRTIGPPFARSITTWRRMVWPVKQRLLRVLRGVHHNSLQQLFENVNLRYLESRNPHFSSGTPPLWELPTSISLLWNLQTLIIRKSRSTTVVAPVEIWKMRQLRHVEGCMIYIPDPPNDLFHVLENLATLKTAVNLRLSEEVCGMIPNVKRLHLLYNGELQGYDDSLIECVCNLDRLHKLESLNLSIMMSRRSRWAFPSSLNKLSLSYCQLHWEDLRVVGSLPQLEVLNLGIHAVMLGQEWSPVSDQFLHLKFLKIDFCDLVCWNAADCASFPVLEKLVLSRLPYLEEIPWDIGEIPTLELIRVDRCSESAAFSAIKIKEDRLQSMGSDDLQIQVVVYQSHIDRFMNNAEEEGLEIHHIQLRTF